MTRQGLTHAPLALHTPPSGQPQPQVTVLPHASVVVPQLRPSSVQIGGDGTATQAPSVHVSHAEQAPHARSPPHPSEAVPHVASRSAHVTLWHASQTCVTASQTWGLAQWPQSRGIPQPSSTEPHSTPSAAQVVGWQITHSWAWSHVSPAGHAPHWMTWPQLSVIGPHWTSARPHGPSGPVH